MPNTRLILHVKGTEAETRELPREAVKAGISQGQITHSQLIWSPENHAWKQVRELPDLLPGQEVAPAPVARENAVSAPQTVRAIIPESPTGPVARAVAVSGKPQPRVAVTSSVPRARAAVAVAKRPTVRSAGPVLVRSTGELEVEEDEGFHPMKWLCFGLGALLLIIVAGNYFLIDRPLVASLSDSPYSKVTVLAHFGAFMQPNVVVIHIPPSSVLTRDNLTDFLVALARCTPEDPITHDSFDRVAVTSGWTAQYSFSGGSWKELGDMQRENAAQREDFLMEQMSDASGRPVKPESTLDEATQQARRDKIWGAFVAHFTAGT